ncbi:MAG: dTMP kinase [Holosporales bacterium]|jgi:dTMP kinase|nr:dTMP kinase [Holosporales bacterium]
MLITFEGGEGAGKSVQAKLLSEYLISIGIKVVLTREPGGTPLSEEIRKTLLTGDVDKIAPITESLLYLAARSDHWIRKIKPALDNCISVVCDRYQDSSVVYQGICKKVNINLLNIIYSEITNGILPDITYLIDIDPKIGISRSLERNGNIETRFEQMDLSFHKKVRKGFLDLAQEEPHRFIVIDGSLSIEEIHAEIISNLQKHSV